MTKHDQSLARQIAEEVAARYGVAVAPGAVKIVPRGVSGVEYTDLGGMTGWQRKSEAARRNQARARRLREADAAGGSVAPVVSPEAEADARHRAQLLALLAEGVPRGDLAVRMGMSDRLLQAFAAGQRIALPARPRKSRAKAHPKPKAAAKVKAPKAPKAPKTPKAPKAPKANDGLSGAARARANLALIAEDRRNKRAARLDEMRGLIAQGMGVMDICAAMGLTESVVRREVRALDVRPVRALTEAGLAAQARRQALLRVLDGGISPDEAADWVAAEYGVARCTVIKDFRAIGRKMTRGRHCRDTSGQGRPVGWTAERHRAHLALRAQIRAAALEGVSLADLRARFDISRNAMERHIRAIREEGLPEGADHLPAFDRAADTRARHARIEALRRQGLTLDAIVAATGVSLSVVCIVLRNAGLTGIGLRFQNQAGQE